MALVCLARKNEGLIVPGYTHMQRAQPVLLQHLLLAYVEQVKMILISYFVLGSVNRFKLLVVTDLLPNSPYSPFSMFFFLFFFIDFVAMLPKIG